MDYRKYETIFTYLPDVTEDTTKRVNARFQEIIDTDGKLMKIDDWGVRRTAYPVKKRAKAHYFHFTYAAAPGLVSEFERHLRISDDVTKFQSFRLQGGVTPEELEQEVVYATTTYEERKPRRDDRERRSYDDDDDRGDRGERRSYGDRGDREDRDDDRGERKPYGGGGDRGRGGERGGERGTRQEGAPSREDTPAED